MFHNAGYRISMLWCNHDFVHTVYVSNTEQVKTYLKDLYARTHSCKNLFTLIKLLSFLKVQQYTFL